MVPVSRSSTQVVQPAQVTAEQGNEVPVSAARRGLWQSLWPPLVFLGAGILLWHLFVAITGIAPYLLPAPADVGRVLLDMRWGWFRQAGVTTLEVLGGFLLSGALGVLIGVTVTWSTPLRQAVLPFLVLFNSLPKIALAPLFIIWLGYGILPNIFIAFLIAFFPVALNTARGLEEIDRDFLDLATTLRAARWRVYVQIRIPNALPYIFTGLKIAATEAVVGAVVGEFVASSSGLASLIMSAQASLSTAAIIGALVWISAIGFLLFGVITLLERWLMPWAASYQMGR